MMRPPPSICSPQSRALSCASPLTPPTTRSPSTKRRGAGCDGRHPTGQDGDRVWCNKAAETRCANRRGRVGGWPRVLTVASGHA